MDRAKVRKSLFLTRNRPESGGLDSPPNTMRRGVRTLITQDFELPGTNDDGIGIKSSFVASKDEATIDDLRSIVICIISSQATTVEYEVVFLSNS